MIEDKRRQCVRLTWEYIGAARYGLEKALDALAEGHSEEEELRRLLVEQEAVLEALQLRVLDHLSNLLNQEGRRT